MCPGPLHQGCTSLEVPTLATNCQIQRKKARCQQSWRRRTALWRRVLNSSIRQGRTIHLANKNIVVTLFPPVRYACSIPDTDNEEVIITGGKDTTTTVSVYNEAGWQRDLAQLTQGRYDHACSSFTHTGEKVILGFHILLKSKNDTF